MDGAAIGALMAAARAPETVAACLREQGQSVIRVLGSDAPYPLLRAAGLAPVRLVANTALPSPAADALIGTATLSKSGRSILEQILADEQDTPLLITHANSEQPQLFAALRELINSGDMRRPVHFIDLLHMDRDSSRAYNRVRVEQLGDWLQTLDGSRPIDPAWPSVVDDDQRNQHLLRRARTLRDTDTLITGAELLAMVAAAHILPPSEFAGLMKDALAEASGRTPGTGERIYLAGDPQLDEQAYQAVSQAGFDIVGDYHDWGDPLICIDVEGNDWQSTFSDPAWRKPLMLQPLQRRVEQIARNARASDAHRVLYLVAPGGEASAWDAETACDWLRDEGFEAGFWRTDQPLPAREQLFVAATEQPAVPTDNQNPKPKSEKPRQQEQGQRSKKNLASVASFGTYQREWFADLRRRVNAGAPFVAVNANAPQEILRAMDIPFVVNQWWASIVAAKQQSRRYFRLLRQHHYPADVEAYSSQGLAALFDDDPEQAPWGGLPKPDAVHAVLSTDATPRIFEHWAREADADLFLFERTVDPRLDIAPDWWDRLPSRWDEELETARIDLMVAELKTAISDLKRRTGHGFDEARFEHIMNLVNEQEDYYRRTRDLIASTHPAPVGIVDTMPATMVPQWHRGTEWARDAARDFFHEVEARVTAGEAACAKERLRLMWLGRGMWSDMGFYQRWQESHGAVFVWSMYLALAADGYIREFDRNRDPLRALAARFITMGDELRMPTWAGAWHVREAQTHGIHGAVALSDADPFVVRALRRAGFPVLALELDNYNRERDSAEETDRLIAGFLDSLN